MASAGRWSSRCCADAFAESAAVRVRTDAVAQERSGVQLHHGIRLLIGGVDRQLGVGAEQEAADAAARDEVSAEADREAAVDPDLEELVAIVDQRVTRVDDSASVRRDLEAPDVPARRQRSVELARSLAAVDGPAEELEALVDLLVREVDDARSVRADPGRGYVAAGDESAVQAHRRAAV